MGNVDTMSYATDLAVIADGYRRWADIEADGSSPTYARLARAVADDKRVLRLLAEVDPSKRQPNLLFGALRWIGAPVDQPTVTIEALLDRRAEVLDVIKTRRTQTNEVARCATLLPALASLPSPLALVEVGASAGLCLMFDRWRYRYREQGGDRVLGPVDSPVILGCTVIGPVPLPTALPRVVWRCGLDLAPVDASDPDARRWLTCLVWPEHTDRAERLDAVLRLAAEHPAPVAAGDLVDDLPRLLAGVPSGATVVVMHSATLAYVDAGKRAAFLGVIRAFGAHRVGAEGPGVLPHLAHQLPPHVGGRFVVSVDDRVVALAHPHGSELVSMS
jgi:hypothetical protein